MEGFIRLQTSRNIVGFARKENDSPAELSFDKSTATNKENGHEFALPIHAEVSISTTCFINKKSANCLKCVFVWFVQLSY